MAAGALFLTLCERWRSMKVEPVTLYTGSEGNTGPLSPGIDSAGHYPAMNYINSPSDKIHQQYGV
jgi:hypothetical protein